MKKEIWKDIAGWEGLYQVSTLGNVRSLDRKVRHYRGGMSLVKGRIMKKNRANEYDTVLLYRSAQDNHRKGIHVLVAEAFIPNPDNKPTVNHKNTVKTDNWLDNLEWATCRYQQLHAIENGLKNMTLGENSNLSRLKKEQVIEIRRIFDNKEMTIKELAVKFGTAKSNIQYIVNRETWKHI